MRIKDLAGILAGAVEVLICYAGNVKCEIVSGIPQIPFLSPVMIGGEILWRRLRIIHIAESELGTPLQARGYAKVIGHNNLLGYGGSRGAGQH